MSYFKALLTENERPIHKAHLHWIYLIDGVLWLSFLSLAGFIFVSLLWKKAGYLPVEIIHILEYRFVISASLFEWICIGGGFIIFLVYFLKYTSTEVLLTDKRILYKTGFISVRAEELELQEIKEERVDHGLFGYILDYGKIHLDCRFVKDLDLPVLVHPIQLMKAIYKARAKFHAQENI